MPETKSIRSRDPLKIRNAESVNKTWIAYPSLGPKQRIDFVLSNKKVIHYISLPLAIRFLLNPWDNRNIILKFHQNWLDDERLSLIKEKAHEKFLLQKNCWDKPSSKELNNGKSS